MRAEAEEGASPSGVTDRAAPSAPPRRPPSTPSWSSPPVAAPRVSDTPPTSGAVWASPANTVYLPPPPPAYSPPAYSPPPYLPPAPTDGGRVTRTKWLLVSIVAGVVVVGLVVTGVVLITNRHHHAVVPDAQLYAPLAGYTFESLPPGAVAVARSPFDNVPELHGVLDDLSGGAIVRNGRTVADVLVYQFHQSLGSTAAASQEFLAGATAIASQHEDITIAGHEGVYYVVGSSEQAIAVFLGDAAVIVEGPFGGDRSELESLTTSIVDRLPAAASPGPTFAA